MTRILFIVSTLKRSGPTNQLFNLINQLDRNEFEAHLVTLSPEKSDSEWDAFVRIGVNVRSLNLSRIAGLFFGKRLLKSYIDSIQPKIIHTHGIRADSLLASLQLAFPWVITAHNFPYEDYPSKFGRVKGSLMVRQHLAAMRRCKHLVYCSKSIGQKLTELGINGQVIQNGTPINIVELSELVEIKQLPRPIYISVGSLIPRKNMGLLLDAFKSIKSNNKGSLVILGEGPLMSELKLRADENVHFFGSVNNVPNYLAASDYFISTSLSEGLPNTVLEALAAGVPVILSDIDSHLEIAEESKSACKIFSLQGGKENLMALMLSAPVDFDSESRNEARRIAKDVFSAKRMSMNYQALYHEILGEM